MVVLFCVSDPLSCRSILATSDPHIMIFQELEADILVLPLICLAGAALVYVVYLAALPQPLPCIPYNMRASRSLFGDLKEMKRAQYRRQWIWQQPSQHNSPVSQAFLFPFRRPTVIVSDYREVMDICSRRSKEFDRSNRNKECVGLTAPEFHFTMKSSDSRFKCHRELIRDLMTPKFLKEISAPRVYDRVTLLVELWDLKRHKAHGRPFSAGNDLYLATLDIICSVAFGMEDTKTALRHEIGHVRSVNPGVSRIADDPVIFPPGPIDPEIVALLDIPEMVAVAQKSAFPTFSQWLALLNPKHARAQWHRRRLIQRQTVKSLHKLANSGSDGCESALDQLLWREMNAAKKADRQPDFYSARIRDEVLGYLLGGHDSTATVLAWWVKYMSSHQRVQVRLRKEIYNTHHEAHQNGRWPTMEEISDSSIPFLDAVMEETLRCASVATLIVRTSTCDTQILGYPIPKGTDIILPLSGPSMTEPALPINELLRSSASQNASDRVPAWGDDIDQYIPERWLKRIVIKPNNNNNNGDGGAKSESFDPHAGPTLAFSAGPRQCFGKKLAYLELRTMITLLLWNFEFESMDESLNGPEIVERLVNLPKDCYVRLKRV